MLPQPGGSQPGTAKARDLQINTPSSADSCGDPGLQALRALGLLAHVHVCTQEQGVIKEARHPVLIFCILDRARGSDF